MIQEVKQKIILKNGQVFWSGEVIKVITEEYEKGIQTNRELGKITKEYVGKVIDADEFHIKLDASRKYSENIIRIPSYEINYIESFEE
jgi:hypothetical protein